MYRPANSKFFVTGFYLWAAAEGLPGATSLRLLFWCTLSFRAEPVFHQGERTQPSWVIPSMAQAAAVGSNDCKALVQVIVSVGAVGQEIPNLRPDVGVIEKGPFRKDIEFRAEAVS